MASPYRYEEGQPLLVPSFVCYCDILGYSAMTQEAFESGEAESFLRRLRTALKEAREELVRNHGDSELGPPFDMKVFTDDIVVGYPVRNPGSNAGEPELSHVLHLFSWLQARLAVNGFFLRGGVAYGDFYMDDEVVFGGALLEAVSLDKQGGPPRLRLSKDVVELVRRQMGFYGRARRSPQWESYLEDADGAVFVDYLHVVFEAFPDAVFLDLVQAHRAAVEARLTKFKGVPSVRAKYEWLARYHNYFCAEAARRYPIPHSPDADELLGCATEEAQKLLEEIIDIEAAAPTPSRLKDDPRRP